MGGALEGVKVVELASWVAMPGAAGIMSDWGAEVIKIEDPRTGDPLRGWRGRGFYRFDLPVCPHFDLLSRNKRGIALNLQHEEARQIVYRLVKDADIFATNYQPRVLSNLSMRYEDLAQINPRLVYASLTGYGAKGPEADRQGFDWSAYWAGSGLMSNLNMEGKPPLPRPAIGDLPTAGFILAATLAALWSRDKTGRGQKVDLALLHCGMWQSAVDVQAALISGQDVDPLQRREMGDPLNIDYRTSDGKWIMLVMPQSDRYWPSFCRAIGRLELVDDARFSSAETRVAHCTELIDLLDQIIGGISLAQLAPALDQNGCIWAKVRTTMEVVNDEQVAANEFIVDLQHPILGPTRTLASPGRFSETPSRVRSAAPDVGQHTDEILLDLGYEREAIGEMKAKGAIG